jgi:CRP-like cAMP-binding protein
MSNVQRETFSTGQFIFLEGHKDFHFYIIEEGRVEIFTNDGGNYIKISEIGPGESFGEFAMLDRSPRSASARAITEVCVVKVSEQGFEELLAQIPGWASSMLKSFAIRLKSMNERLKSSPQFLPKK